jgi:hypothetical protein
VTAIEAITDVRNERGRWWVYLTVLFPDAVVRHKINHYHTRERATIAADIIRRTANRSYL